MLDLGGLAGRKSITLGNVQDGQDVDAQTPPVTAPIPPRAKKVEARLVATGHGFGTSLDCAEFCQMRQDVFAGEVLHSSNFWRSDCTKNPVGPQAGTWKYARNGWCPGSIVVGREIDLTPDLVPAQDGTIDFDTRLGDGTEYKNSIANSGPAYEWVSLALLVWE